MPKTTKQPDHHRDAQLRRRMINQARLNHDRYADGFVPYAVIIKATDDRGNPVDDAGHAERLIDDLLRETLLATRKPIGLDRHEMPHDRRHYRITDYGWELWAQRVPPHALVADDRDLPRD